MKGEKNEEYHRIRAEKEICKREYLVRVQGKKRAERRKKKSEIRKKKMKRERNKTGIEKR